jgi:hypothetical protein
MPRLLHGGTVSLAAVHTAAAEVAAATADVPFAFAAAVAADVQDFDYLFPKLQENDKNLLPVSRRTRDGLVELGRSMRDAGGESGDSRIPAGYTYFGQFVDHDVTLETTSATAAELVAPNLVPLDLDDIRARMRNLRTATLDLDSVYGPPAPRNGDELVLGNVTPLGGSAPPLLRPPGKDDHNDVPRQPRADGDPANDRAALIGDPRNDENTIIAQLQVAFLRAHNELVDQGYGFERARKTLRQHYQHIVVHDFLPRICDPKVVRRVLKEGNKLYHPFVEPFFMPLEYAVAAYRFGHSMIRADYDFNINFNTSGDPGTLPASLQLLFTFTALSGQLGFPGQQSDTLPENWIIEWENFVEVKGGRRPNFARRVDTKLVEPLFELTDIQGRPEPGDQARLAVRNLLRGYLLRIPTGQAVARQVRKRWGTPVLSKRQLERGAASEEQVRILRDAGFLERTPLWYYLLAESSVLGKGRHLGPVGSFLVAEVLIGLARRSEDSILRLKRWKPTLPSARRGRFELADLLRLAGVL